MECRHPIVTESLLVAIALLVSLPYSIAEEAKQDKATKKPARGTGEVIVGELSTIANHLTLNPNTAVDFTHISDEYCFSADVNKGAHMTHYATDPTKTQEDVIDFVNAEKLIKDGVVNIAKMPRLPETLGSMIPNQRVRWAVGGASAGERRGWGG